MSDPKLSELEEPFRGKLAAILDQLAQEGWQPRISNALRTREQQEEKFRLGYAMSPDPGSHGRGLAADVIDQRWGWELSERNARFFARLVDLALAAGLVAGGAWFGRGGTREKPAHRSPWNRWGLGWDVAHVEYRKP